MKEVGYFLIWRQTAKQEKGAQFTQFLSRKKIVFIFIIFKVIVSQKPLNFIAKDQADKGRG